MFPATLDQTTHTGLTSLSTNQSAHITEALPESQTKSKDMCHLEYRMIPWRLNIWRGALLHHRQKTLGSTQEQIITSTTGALAMAPPLSERHRMRLRFTQLELQAMFRFQWAALFITVISHLHMVQLMNILEVTHQLSTTKFKHELKMVQQKK